MKKNVFSEQVEITEPINRQPSQPGNFIEPENFRIIAVENGLYNKFGARKHDMVVQIKDPPSNESSLEWLQSAVDELYVYIMSLFKNTDKVGITFNSDTFKVGPAIMSFRYLYNINPGDIWRLIFNITQSAIDFAINDKFKISVFGIRMPNVQGIPKTNVIDRITRKFIIQIINFNPNVNDVRNKMCLPRAIEVTKAHYNRRLGSSEKKIL